MEISSYTKFKETSCGKLPNKLLPVNLLPNGAFSMQCSLDWSKSGQSSDEHRHLHQNWVKRTFSLQLFLVLFQVKTAVPFLLHHTLREYQHIGLDWLVTMYEKQLNGILADEMGLGKTIETIALLAHLACDKEIWGPHLIVVPTSVMLNWEYEFKKWVPGFKILTYYGTQKERKLKRQVH